MCTVGAKGEPTLSVRAYEPHRKRNATVALLKREVGSVGAATSKAAICSKGIAVNGVLLNGISLGHLAPCLKPSPQLHELVLACAVNRQILLLRTHREHQHVVFGCGAMVEAPLVRGAALGGKGGVG